MLRNLKVTQKIMPVGAAAPGTTCDLAACRVLSCFKVRQGAAQEHHCKTAGPLERAGNATAGDQAVWLCSGEGATGGAGRLRGRLAHGHAPCERTAWISSRRLICASGADVRGE